jgi:TctA family transporter
MNFELHLAHGLSYTVSGMAYISENLGSKLRISIEHSDTDYSVLFSSPLSTCFCIPGQVTVDIIFGCKMSHQQAHASTSLLTPHR